MATRQEDEEAEEARSVAIGLLAFFWLVLAGLWNGIAPDLLWSFALVVVVLAGLFMIRSGTTRHEVFLPTLGSGLLLAVVVPFLIHLGGGATGPGGPWVPVAAAVATPFLAWPRLGVAEQLMALLGAVGIVLFMVQTVAPTVDLTALTVSALLLMVALSVAVVAPPREP